ncbi:hypothetical protein CEXT_190311 [Caerostris extrusa]|uniref:Uncharacterized protein n=1 Tax=Caerostris extrusa TaxID=172846 RepID=A0AAV4RDY9_CAEEX|nr:hypothetical protein CEXT_190311 [Caerostris extrusa]
MQKRLLEDTSVVKIAFPSAGVRKHSPFYKYFVCTNPESNQPNLKDRFFVFESGNQYFLALLLIKRRPRDTELNLDKDNIKDLEKQLLTGKEIKTSGRKED